MVDPAMVVCMWSKTSTMYNVSLIDAAMYVWNFSFPKFQFNWSNQIINYRFNVTVACYKENVNIQGVSKNVRWL